MDSKRWEWKGDTSRCKSVSGAMHVRCMCGVTGFGCWGCMTQLCVVPLSDMNLRANGDNSARKIRGLVGLICGLGTTKRKLVGRKFSGLVVLIARYIARNAAYLEGHKNGPPQSLVGCLGDSASCPFYDVPTTHMPWRAPRTHLHPYITLTGDTQPAPLTWPVALCTALHAPPQPTLHRMHMLIHILLHPHHSHAMACTTHTFAPLHHTVSRVTHSQPP